MSYVTTGDNVKLYVKDWGKGRPVVMMHGWPRRRSWWRQSFPTC